MTGVQTCALPISQTHTHTQTHTQTDHAWGLPPAALCVAAVHVQQPGRPALHPGAQRLDGGAVHAPLRHAKLTQVSPGVAGQGLAVLKVEPTQLTAGIWRERGRSEWGRDRRRDRTEDTVGQHMGGGGKMRVRGNRAILPPMDTDRKSVV